MGGRLLTGIVALLLALSGSVGPGSVGSGSAAVSAASQPTVTMTAVNDGRSQSLLDPHHPVWAHLSPTGAVAKVTVTVQLNGTLIRTWDSHLDTPDSFQGVTPPDCRGAEEAAPKQVSCDFVVQAAPGINRLQFTFTADDGAVTLHLVGTLTGGLFDWDAGWEVLDATGQWSAISHDDTISLPATLSSALRWVVTNTGDVPFRVTNGCDDRILVAHTQLVCTVRGVRPVQSLARSYAERLRLEDVVGAAAEVDIDTRVRSFAGVFALGSPSVTVGQVLVVRANGLPPGESFVMEFRIDDEPVLVGTRTTRIGSTHLSFPVPSTSPGTAHLEVVHDGLTIASLPFDVTLVPRRPDAAAPAWPWLLAVLVPVVGLGLLLVQRRRRRRRAAPAAAPLLTPPSPEASPGPPRSDPYPDATPATPEPAAGRRR